MPGPFEPRGWFMPCPLHSNHPAPAPSEAAVKLVRLEKFVKDVCGKVEKGCTPHVVAFARGLSLRDFWIVWALGLAAQEKEEKDVGEREKTFADFVHRVQLALAEARIDAEMRVHQKSPHVYLESSPACTGGGSWKRKRSEPPTDEERFERSPLEYLRYAESCISGAYSLDPVARKEFETPCVQCRVGFFDKMADDLKNLFGGDVEEIEVDERGNEIKRPEIAPPAGPSPLAPLPILGEGCPQQSQDKNGGVRAQGERGIKGPAP